MTTTTHPDVAILLATYNGETFVEQQINSLRNNTTRFTLHWLDDHSTDNTAQVVRSSAQRASIELVEWQQPRHLGFPSSFFRLIECVEADIYFFCDQDDIWQAAKIDFAVANLMSDVGRPVLCFTNSLMFTGNESCTYARPVHSKRNVRRALREPPMFAMFSPAMALGHTQAFTKPLREIFLRHKAIAYAYAFAHDWWMYDIAVTTGSIRMLPNAPTVFWRQHENSFRSNFGGKQPNRVSHMWRATQLLRQVMAQHARGFLYAVPTLPPGGNLDRLCMIAKQIELIDKKRTPAALARLAQLGAIRRKLSWRVWLLFACLCCDAGRPGTSAAP